MHVRDYIELLRVSERQLAEALTMLAGYHGEEPEIRATGRLLASWSWRHVQTLTLLGERYLLAEPLLPDIQLGTGFHGPRDGSLGLLRDLHEAWLQGQEAHLRWTVLGQVARALHDKELAAICAELGGETDRQLAWLRTHIAQRAPQALVVDP